MRTICNYLKRYHKVKHSSGKIKLVEISYCGCRTLLNGVGEGQGKIIIKIIESKEGVIVESDI